MPEEIEQSDEAFALDESLVPTAANADPMIDGFPEDVTEVPVEQGYQCRTL